MRDSNQIQKQILLGQSFLLLLALGSGCSAFGDLTETKDQVVETNTKMDRLISNTDTTVDEIKKGNSHQEDLKKGMEEGLPKMDGLIDISRETQGVLLETNTELNKVKEALDETNRNLRELIEQGVRNEEGLDATVDAVTSTNARIDELTTMMGEMVGAIDEQKAAFLRDTLDKLGSNVSNDSKENPYRVASAMLIFRILRDYDLEREWFEVFFGAQLESCDRTVANPGGSLCQAVFHIIGPDKSLPGSWQESIRDRVSKLPLLGRSWIPVGSLHANPIWSLALGVDAVEDIEDKILSEEGSPVFPIVKEFMEYSRDILIESLESGVQLIQEREPQRNEVKEFLRRAKTVVRIMEIESCFDQAWQRRLTAAKEALLDKIDPKSTKNAEFEEVLHELELL